MVRTIQWFVGSPLYDALHGYDTEVAVHALQDPPPPKEETMSTTHPHPYQKNTPAQPQTDLSVDLSTLLAACNELDDKVDHLVSDQNDTDGIVLIHENTIQELRQSVLELQQDVRRLLSENRALAERLDALPQPKTRERDDTNDRIIAYLRDSVPGVWMTPGTVAANMKIDGKSAASRLERLSGLTNAVVERVGGKGSGAHPMYRVVPPPRSAQPEA